MACAANAKCDASECRIWRERDGQRVVRRAGRLTLRCACSCIDGKAALVLATAVVARLPEGNKVSKIEFLRGIVITFAGLLLLSGCAEPPAETPDLVAPADVVPAEPEQPVRDPRLAAFAPLPELMEATENPITLAKVNLGRKLYYDDRLSKNQDVSCNTCHLLDKFGVDGLKVSVGHRDQFGNRNAPTVYNAAGQIAQFRDGRAATVEDQAKSSPLDPLEMAMPDEAAVEAVLKSIPGYAPMFAAAFPDDADAVNFNNMAMAIGAFERGLITRSRFDDYIAGDDTALTAAEVRGLNDFMDAGCSSCHSGAYVGGSMYQKLGIIKPWQDSADTGESDLGRFEVTGIETDRQLFKVPSLRNVSHTAPYFHNGSVASLNEAVRLMAEHQLGIPVSNEQVISIIAFLNALDGSIDEAYIAMPELPASSDTTPAPDPN
jgi:cytochrome c peroxidase